uniref:Uncharacterized protein n=1 Tax=Tetranychus urticae TaxID=32264 RepID=T1JXP9_TETUR
MPMESSKMYSFRGFRNSDGFDDKPSETSTNKLIRSIDTLSNSIRAMKQKNVDIDGLLGHRSLSVPLTDQTMSTYSYISPTQPMSHDLPPLTDIEEHDDEGHGVYGEELFSQFNQLNGVPSIDLASLPGNEHYPNLLMDGQEIGNGLDDRNDPMNQIFSRGSLLENSLDNPFDPKGLSFGGNRMGNMNLDLLLSGKPNFEGRNLFHKWLGPDLNEKPIIDPSMILSHVISELKNWSDYFGQIEQDLRYKLNIQENLTLKTVAHQEAPETFLTMSALKMEKILEVKLIVLFLMYLVIVPTPMCSSGYRRRGQRLILSIGGGLLGCKIKTVTIPVHFPIPYHYHHHHNHDHHNHHTHHGHSSHHKPDHWTHRNDYSNLHSKWHYPQHYIHPSMFWI